jgi:hypothetical protein
MKPEPADIVLFPVIGGVSSLASRLVTAGEDLLGIGRSLERYSHVAILANSPGMQYEAKWPRTGLFRTEERRPREIWHAWSLTKDQRYRILCYCQEHKGEFYGLIKILSFGLINSVHLPVCSSFAGYAYASAGFHISPEGEKLVSPNVIADDRRFRMVAREGDWKRVRL